MTWQSTGRLLDATPTHSTPVLPTAVTAEPADRHTHHVLAMRTPCAGHTLARPSTVTRHHHTPTAHATPEQQGWPQTHSEPAPAGKLATVTLQPNTPAEWRVHQGAFHTKHPALTYPVLAKHRSTTLEALAYPTKHRCSRDEVRETQTIEWTTYRSERAYLLQYVYNYLIQGHERNRKCVQMNAAATEIIHQGSGFTLFPGSSQPSQRPGSPQREERTSTHINQRPRAACLGRKTRTPSYLRAPTAPQASHWQLDWRLWHYDQMKWACCGNTT